jgi:hypothetical protein
MVKKRTSRDVSAASDLRPEADIAYAFMSTREVTSVGVADPGRMGASPIERKMAVRGHSSTFHHVVVMMFTV